MYNGTIPNNYNLKMKNTCLKKLMQISNISAAELSRRTGVSTQAMHAYLHDKATPMPEQSYKITSYFNSLLSKKITLDNFYNFEELTDDEYVGIARDFATNYARAKVNKNGTKA